MKKRNLAVFALSAMLLAGCAQTPAKDEPINETPVQEVPQGITVGEPNGEVPAGDNSDLAAGIVQAGADEARKIDVTTVKSIELFDVDGNAVDKAYTDEEMTAIAEAYNNAMIDDISYIEMLAGLSMKITLDNDQTIFITSYGDETRIVATTNDQTYHLICPEIGKILLSEVE